MKSKPILKWAGGKRMTSAFIVEIIINNFNFNFNDNKYFEPFFGGGAVFFDLDPNNALLNDLNEEIINLMLEIKNNEKKLICKFKEMENKFLNGDDNYYYEVREMDRSDGYKSLDKSIKAARMLFLNKFGFNGLYRVNSNGYFNVPVGKPASGKFKEDFSIISNVETMSKYLNQKEKNFEFINGDFSDCLNYAKSGDIVYFDPPYDKLESNSFTSYTKNGFEKEDTLKLKKVADELVNRGVNVIISNNSTDFILSLFTKSEVEYKISNVGATWGINPDATQKRKITEVVIYNLIKNDKK